MGYILRIGFRHLESLRFQTLATSMGFNWSKRQFDFNEWIQEQAPELVPHLDFLNGYDDIPKAFSHERSWHYAIILNSLLTAYENRSEDPGIQYRFRHSMVSTSMSNHQDEDHAGTDRGGSWNVDPFPFRAGTILTLGALEEFERGTIRILTGLEYSGTDYKDSDEPFLPRLAEFESTNPKFDQLDSEQKTFTRAGRLKILKSFGLTKPSNEDWFTRLQDSYKNRNQLAHGLSPVNVTLSMFLQTHYDVFSAMRWLSDEFAQHQNVEL